MLLTEFGGVDVSDFYCYFWLDETAVI